MSEVCSGNPHGKRMKVDTWEKEHEMTKTDPTRVKPWTLLLGSFWTVREDEWTPGVLRVCLRLHLSDVGAEQW